MNVRYFEKRPGAWHLDFRTEGKRLRPFGGTTEREARANAASTIAQALAGLSAPADPAAATVPAPKGGPTILDSFRRAMREREGWLTSKSKGTLQTTFDAIVAAGGLNESTPTSALTRDLVRALRVRWMAEEGKRKGSKLSPSSINHRLSMLSALLEAEDLAPHTVKHLSTKGNRRERRITGKEVATGIAWLRMAGVKGAETLADMIEVALLTGAREGELLALPWADVAQDTLTFRDTKNSQSRTIPIGEREQLLIEARRGRLHGPFADLTGDRITDLWGQMRAAMGLAHDAEFVFHALRHEFASRHADRGTDAFTLMSLMGHSNITTTQVYVKASLGAMRRARGLPIEGALS